MKKADSPQGTPIENDVAFYDKYNYDYATYWKSREYEHDSEVYALSRLLREDKGIWFADIGGSYGRHVPLYKDNFQNCVLIDYSLNALKKASTRLSQQHIYNVYPVAANVYHLPFRENVFDETMMIRVIHHLEDPSLALTEISRTTQDKGIFILEFPNKLHLKSIIKALFRFDFGYLFSLEPVQVKTEKPEGAEKSDRSIMLNYSPKHIRTLLLENSFDMGKIRAVSFLRIPSLKRILGPKLLIPLDHALQNLFGWIQVTPSIILQTRKNNPSKSYSPPPDRLADILVCPSCRGSLSFSQKSYKCETCKLTFPVLKGIPDLRYPQVPAE